jgi:hypothetical protein
MSDSEYQERLKSTGRNDRCPCGSGKKYKKCHLADDEAQRSAALKALQEEAKARAAEEAEAEEDGGEAGSSKASGGKAAKGRRPTGRGKGKSGSKGKATDAKPKDLPRRSAV